MKNKVIQIGSSILIPDLAYRLGLKPFEIMGDLIRIGIFPAPNQPLEPSTAAKICTLHGFSLQGSPAPTGQQNEIIAASTHIPSDLDEIRMKLRSMIGLEDVKDRVNRIIDMVRWQDALKASNRRSPEISHHMIFSGNPGTGKTTVARIMGDFFKSLRMLSKGHFVEIDRQGLVGGYIGQTAEKTMKVLQESLGGVLFIDEAYSLVSGSENDFGKEAISTLLKFMEDNRGNLIVIAAGYEKDMEAFVKSNPGLESRFKTKIAFPDYSNIECVRIFEELARSSSLVIENDEVTDRICEIVEKIRIFKGETFANGRDMRNLFEVVIGHIATRFFGNKKNKQPEDIYTIKVEDIASALRELECGRVQ